MSTSELDKYKVDHLFLLIGENPLPNYVAAKTLLEEGGKPYLVFTEHTDKPAKRLKEELGLSDQELVPLDNYQSNAHEIKERIRQKIKEIQSNFPDKKQFGLNYTGGTKAMAVHAYQALLHPDKEKSDIKLVPPPFLSYLDSSSLKMLIDQEKDHPIPCDISKESLELSLEKLFRLHGLSLSKVPKIHVTLPELVEAIVKNNLAWREWCKNQLYIEGRQKEEVERVQTKLEIQDKETNENQNNLVTEIYFKFGEWKNATNLRDLSLPIHELPKEITYVLEKYNFLDCNGNLSIQTIEESLQQIEDKKRIPKPKKNKDYPKEICKWLEGIWLEDYVLQQLKKIEIECLININDIGMSFDFPEKADIAFFEFDVAFLRGYQLFAISCTTDNTENLCKSKLFEAYRRARLMGGDEARIALVCYSDKPNKIKQSFRSQINDSKVRVFGSQDITDLSEKLKAWIQEVDA
ncbi:DUF1887 family protein [Anabaena sphaerica FACHB-251]|uniref:DUF1887 family protein n=1 Tax=Anabaena sphaerica FACHB-251 TaxID=2692883 RepID=A0A926WJR8_9NOST|nr:DUF1887 family CARF protein [Anabaena sphaerica]MBD2295124.1 DUF1887 family protein [Anabaena sphaerica FACHB-251]